jgi:hypothetical protein
MKLEIEVADNFLKCTEINYKSLLRAQNELGKLDLWSGVYEELTDEIKHFEEELELSFMEFSNIDTVIENLLSKWNIEVNNEE